MSPFAGNGTEWEHQAVNRRVGGCGRWLVAAAVVVAMAGCASQGNPVTGTSPTVPATPSPSLPPFPATLNADGTVPWVNAPAIDPIVTHARAVPKAVGPTCTARQLRGVLPAWIYGEASNDGGMDPLAAASLHGWVNLTNTSARACTLDGVPTVKLLSQQTPVSVEYGKFGTGQAVKVGLPAHGAANFRIDWGAPFCPSSTDGGPYSLRAVVDGVTLGIAMDSTDSPRCMDQKTNPSVTSSVATSPIEPGAVSPERPKAAPFPVHILTATAGDYPAEVEPGQLLKFVITLANPTGTAVSLAAPPHLGYAVGAYCARTPSTPGYQFAQLYSLDNRPRPAVPAHGRVRFAMQLTIPALTCPSHRVSITWQSPQGGFGLPATHTEFTIAVTG
jgi:hypothetical protein